MRRHYYVTPSSYLQLIKLYKTLLEERKDKINQKKNRICNGLQVRFIGPRVITLHYLVPKSEWH
jgi:dynein heavy chain